MALSCIPWTDWPHPPKLCDFWGDFWSSQEVRTWGDFKHPSPWFHRLGPSNSQGHTHWKTGRSRKTPSFSMEAPRPLDTHQGGQVPLRSTPFFFFSTVNGTVSIGLQQRVASTTDTGPLNFIHGWTCFNKCRLWEFSASSNAKNKEKLKELGCSANHFGAENSFDLRLWIGTVMNLPIWDTVHSFKKSLWNLGKKMGGKMDKERTAASLNNQLRTKLTLGFSTAIQTH